MGFAQLQHWTRAQFLHDRVRVSTSRPADLLLPDVNIVHIRRCSPVHPKHILRQAEQLGEGFRARVLVDTRQPRPAAMELTRALGVEEVREWLKDDVSELVEVFREQLGYSTISAKLEVLGGTPCPRFHADHVGVRLLVTYCGPGTVYVENRHVKRRWLWGGAGGVAVASADAAAARQAAEGDLIFLKGHAAPGNYGMGAVHRSPDLEPAGSSCQPSTEHSITIGQDGLRGGGRRRGGPALGPVATAGMAEGGVRGRKVHEGGGDGLGGGGGEHRALRLLLTLDDVVGWASGEACGCGREHGGVVAAAAAVAVAGRVAAGDSVLAEEDHRADATLGVKA